MLNSRHTRAGAAVATLAGGLLAVVSGPGVAATSGAEAPVAAAAAPVAPAAPAADGSIRTFTLITGDKVTAHVGADGRLSGVGVRAADGGDVFTTTYQDTDGVYVVPAGVQEQIDAGVVDKELFNITKLLADGYDDASRATLPVIVGYDSTREAAGLASAAPAGATVERQLPVIRSAAVKVDKKRAAKVWAAIGPRAHRGRAPGGTVAGAAPKTTAGGAVATKIWLDDVVQRSDLGTPTVPLTGATAAHRLGYDGTGVKVAVLDTGYDTAHPDLAGQVVGSASFVPWATDVLDINGHGTHTASTVAGTGAASHGKYAGMAPGAKLLIGKVLDNTGAGSDSTIVAGMQWAVDQGAQVVSMSLGASGIACEGPDVDALRALSDRALFVVAAGNDGAAGTVSTPGCAPEALTVGAVDRSNDTAYFSSRGPVFGGVAAKPDISSQGVDVVAARAGGRGDLAYVSESGTSMATPHVAGGAALVLQEHPDYTPAMVKDLLTSSARDTDDPVLEQGAGPMDLARAVDQSVVADPNTQLGDYSYPQRSLDAETLPVRLRNLGKRATTLSFGLEDLLGGDAHTRLPGSMVKLPRSSVTVPAGGSATVGVRIDPSVPVREAAYDTETGRLVGTDRSGDRVEIPFSFYLEPPSVDVKVVGIDRFGNGASSPSTFDLVDAVHGQAWHLSFVDQGSTTVRVPIGVYTVVGHIASRDEPTNKGPVESLAIVAKHKVDLRTDTTIALDSRRTSPVAWRTDRRSETFGYGAGITYDMSGNGYPVYSSFDTAPTYVTSLYADSDGPEDDRFTFAAATRAYAPRAVVSTAAGKVPYLAAPATPPLHCTGSAPLVSVAAEDLASSDLAGKAVLVDSTTFTPISEVAKDAATAGARLLVVDYPDTVGRTNPNGLGATLPVIALSSDVGARLHSEIDAGPVTLRWSGQQPQTSPYVYNLATVSHGAVPKGTTVVHDRDLAAQETSYYTQADQRSLWTDVQFKIAGMPASLYASGSTVDVLAPVRRTEFYTPSPEVSWTTVVSPNYINGGFAFDGPRVYEAGRGSTTWYKAPMGASLSTARVPLFDRESDRLKPSVPWCGDAAGHDALGAYPDLNALSVQVDGKAAVWDDTGKIGMPQGDAVVTATSQWSRRPEFGSTDWTIGLGVSTTWTFHTSAEKQGPQPALVPQVDVPVDLTNTVAGDRDVPVSLAAVTDASNGAPVDLLQVQAWYAVGTDSDPSTLTSDTRWTAVRVARHGSSWTATVPGVPASSGYVHLKVAMTGTDGSTVTQTMVRAYGLR